MVTQPTHNAWEEHVAAAFPLTDGPYDRHGQSE